MPSVLRHPGVYIEEIPSAVRPITGVSTSNTAFIGFFSRGPLEEPVKVTSFEEFERRFGGYRSDTEAAYQAAAYFLNGGSVAYVVRIAKEKTAKPAKRSFDKLDVEAIDPGEWGNRLHVTIEKAADGTFSLTAEELEAGTNEQLAVEVHHNLTMDPAKADRYAVNVINNDSRLIRVSHSKVEETAAPSEVGPTDSAKLDDNRLGVGDTTLKGDDGSLPDAAAWQVGINALGEIQPEVFNLLCLPGADIGSDGKDASAQFKTVVEAATTYCEAHRAFLLVDPRGEVDNFDEMAKFVGNKAPFAGQYPAASANAAIYFPRFDVPDPLKGGTPRNIGASGTVAGVFASTDAKRGVWKAPAGTEARVRGGALESKLDDSKTGDLNVLGVNVLRGFPVYGNVVWGARTMVGADAATDQWKYVPVRRTALYIEESLNQGLKWVVFEPNDEPLWSSIRLNVGSFMNGLYRQGAFAGEKPGDAYFVKCDKDTTTEADVDRGIVNIVVGFKPLKPAEFVVLRIQQLAGQTAT